MHEVLGLAVVLAQVAPAPAAPAPAAPAPANARALVPPRLLGAPEVAYPKGARGDAVVVVTVTVSVAGSVRSAHATGDEPFASAAEQQIASWRFAPATRGGDPVSAVVRLEIVFHEPAVAVPPPPAVVPPPAQGGTPPAETGGAPTTPPAGPQEVRVTGDRLAPAVSSFSHNEIRQLPGAFGDPFRAIEALPGVTPILSGLPFFYVRGAPPGNVGYFLDGIRVPYLFHIGLGPSVIHPGMVDRVDLYPGGYPARFGRFAGGIVAGEATPPRAELHGEANIRLFDAGALVETGFDNGRGTVLVGGRYSYTAAIISLLAPDLTLDYRDFQVRASYDVTPDDRLSVFSFGAYDLVGRTQNGILDVLFGTEFYRTDVRWDHALSGGGAVRYAVTLGYDQSRIGGQRNAQDTMLGARTEIVKPLADGAYLVRGGADVVVDMNRADAKTYADPEDPEIKRFNNLFPPRNDLAIGARLDVVMKLGGDVELTPGVRVDFYSSSGATAQSIDPRLAARFGVVKGVRIVHAYGIAHQPPSFVLPLPGLTVGKLAGGLQSAYQASGGVEVDLDEATTLTGTVFDNIFVNMNDALGSSSAGNGVDNAFNQRANGSAYGLELFLKRRLTKKIGGYVTYTLSRSTRTIGREHFPSAFDRTHVANAALAYDLGRSWRAGTRLVFYTGVPTQSTPEGLIAPLRNGEFQRDPAFYRIDVRLEKRWTYGETTWLAFVFEVMNVTLHKETFGGQEIGPITIPSIGLEAGF